MNINGVDKVFFKKYLYNLMIISKHAGPRYNHKTNNVQTEAKGSNPI